MMEQERLSLVVNKPHASANEQANYTHNRYLYRLSGSQY